MGSIRIHKETRPRKSASLPALRLPERGRSQSGTRQAGGVWRPYGAQKVSHEERFVIRRRRMRIISLVVGACVGLFGVGGLAFASHTARFQIKHIDIAGNHLVSERVIRAVAETALYDGRFLPFSKHSILFFPRKTLEHTLEKQLPRLADARVSVASLRDGVMLVTVRERTPYALWCLPAEASAQAGENDTCFLLDEYGFVFAPQGGDQLVRNEVFYGGMIRANPVGTWFLPSYFTDVLETVEAVRRVSANVSSLTVLNDQEYHMELEDGMMLLVRFDSDPHTTAENLKVALSSDALRDRRGEIEYIDLRFGNRVYYK